MNFLIKSLTFAWVLCLESMYIWFETVIVGVVNEGDIYWWLDGHLDVWYYLIRSKIKDIWASGNSDS